MGAVGFKISDLGLVKKESRYVRGAVNERFEAVVTHQGIDLNFKSSHFVDREYPYTLRYVTLTRPLQKGQDFTYLPASKRPLDMILSYSKEGMDPETLAIVINKLMVVGQKRVSTDQVEPNLSRIDSEHNLVTKGALSFYQVFQLGVHIRGFAARFEELQNLPAEEFKKLFKGMVLSPQFKIYYGGHPYVMIVLGEGGHKLDMICGAENIGADQVAKSFRKYIGLFDQYYAGFQPYSKYPVVMS